MRQIELTQGQVALVDDDDYDFLVQWKWSAGWAPDPQTFYARRNTRVGERPKRTTLRMHNELTGWAFVDHIDHNGLNNQRGNLRQVTRSQNQMNRGSKVGKSRFKGVTLASNGKWVAAIKIDGRNKHLGRFVTEEEAALMYNQWALDTFGEYAYLNEVEPLIR